MKTKLFIFSSILYLISTSAYAAGCTYTFDKSDPNSVTATLSEEHDGKIYSATVTATAISGMAMAQTKACHQARVQVAQQIADLFKKEKNGEKSTAPSLKDQVLKAALAAKKSKSREDILKLRALAQELYDSKPSNEDAAFAKEMLTVSDALLASTENAKSNSPVLGEKVITDLSSIKCEWFDKTEIEVNCTRIQKICSGSVFCFNPKTNLNKKSPEVDISGLVKVACMIERDGDCDVEKCMKDQGGVKVLNKNDKTISRDKKILQDSAAPSGSR